MTHDDPGIEIESPADDDPAHSERGGRSRLSGQPGSSRLSWLTGPLGVTSCALLLVIAGLLVTMAWRDHRHADRSEQAHDDALKAAEQFSLRMDNFKGSAMPAYQKQVTQMLTAKGKADFKESFPAFEQAYKQGKAVSTGEVKVAAVQSVDDTSATVLVIHDRLVKSDFGTQQQYLRWQVSVAKVHGRWLVDKFESVS